MSNYSVIIVDDELDAITTLEKFLGKYCPNVDIVGTADGVESAVKVLNELQPDILLLDIRMPDGSGFDVLKRYNSAKTKVIFTTAYDAFAIDAFKVNATDYLLKPINPLLLRESISRATEQIRMSGALKELNQILQQQQVDRIALPAHDGKYLTAINDIVRLEADVNYCHVHLADGTSILTAKTLKSFEALLGQNFIRVHQSHLINVRWVTKFLTNDSLLELTGGNQIPVSRRRRSEVQQALESL
jgi:two-component system LytT family response regulator